MVECHPLKNTSMSHAWVVDLFSGLLTAAIMMMAGAHAHANPRYDSWQAEHPFTLSTFPHEQGGARMHVEAFKASGLNTAIDARWMGSQLWPVPESHGLPVIYLAYTPSGAEHFLTHWNEARAIHKNMIAVMLGDELSGRHDVWKSVRECRDWIVNHPDPAISSMVTIASEASGERVSANKGVQNHWNKLFAALEPDVWLAQIYPVRGHELVPSYYSSLEWYFNWAKQHDVAMWCWLNTWSSSIQGIPTESELRLQRFTSLAYGMRGFADFLWTADGSGPSVKGAGYWDGSGKPTRMYRDLQVINREVANIAQSLIRLTPIRAYHMDGRDDGDGVHHWSDSDLDLPAWQRRTGRLANVTGAVNGNHLLVGFFRDRAGWEYFMVVNKDFAKDRNGAALATPVTLSFHPDVTAIQQINRTNGKVRRVEVKDHHTFDLPGGTGELFMIAADTPFAGVDEPALPQLTETSTGRLCALAGNRITLRFNGDARRVVPEIRLLDESNHPLGKDLGEQFERVASADGRTLTLREKGSVLVNKARFRITLHYALAEPLELSKLAGDVNADGQLSAADLDESSSGRADINGDGNVTQADRRLLEKLVNAKPFQWQESFDAYPVGALAGNGAWAEADGFPGSLLAKSWVRQTVLIGASSSGQTAVSGPGAATGFIGNEIRFKTDGGLGEFGVIRWAFTTRAGAEGFQNNASHLFSSQDEAGECGRIAVEQESGQIVLRGGRGVTFAEQKQPAPVGSGHRTDPFRVSVVIDCDRRLLTWKCVNLNNSETIGPYEVPFVGMLKGIDATTVVLRGDGSAIDDIEISSH